MFYYYLYFSLLFLGFPQFKGDFVHDQNNAVAELLRVDLSYTFAWPSWPGAWLGVKFYVTNAK